jgi:hypothetical protein
LRFVDDILVIGNEEADMSWVKHELTRRSLTVEFTEEQPQNGVLRFLDLMLGGMDGFCWEYKPRDGKPVMSNKSSHSRIVKHGVIKGILLNACRKSCQHKMGKAVKHQLNRIREAGYSRGKVKEIVQAVVRSIIDKKEKSKDWEDMKTVVIPFYHGISHRLKKFARKFNINVVFSFPHKLKNIASKSGRKRTPCPTAKSRHEEYIKCKTGAVYSMKFSCGHTYEGQTGKCVNERLKEHMLSIEKMDSRKVEATIATHVKQCGCHLTINETEVLKENFNGKIEREIAEAYEMWKKGNNVISTPSICLQKCELEVMIKC